MLSDNTKNDRWNKKKRHQSMQHKVTASLFVIQLLFLFCISLTYHFLSTWLGKIGFALSLTCSLILAYILAKGTARFLNYKFVEQVNRMTGTARAIANSRDLSKRIDSSSRPDELKNLESALNNMLDQLEESFEMEKRFTADASHELRTPIAVLNGYLDILRQWGKDDPNLLEESISVMKDEIQNMKKLSENLLKMSRLELDDQYNLDWDIVDITNIINILLKETTVIAGNRNIKCKANDPLKIRGDSSLLIQMFRAIIENSIKYTKEDGIIAIEAYSENNQAVIKISDNGPGIPEKDLDKIFARFYRVEKSRDRALGGTGLGLSLVKQIVQLHDGSVKAESVEGKGTTIIFRLPLI